MPNWKKVIISGSDAALNSLNVTTSVTASNISASGDIYTDTLIFNTGSDHSVGGGQVGWNTSDGTLNIGLEDGVVLQAGQELHVRAKAQGAISNGDAVMFAGAEGDHILVSTATQAVLNANPEYFVGIATHNLSNNEFGYISTFGLVRELDTDTPAWDPGTVLWFDSEGVTAGALTSTQPSAPYAQIRVAAVTRRNPAEGVILVRPDRLPKLNDLQDVQHTTPDYGDLIMYNSSSEIWENTKTLSGSYTIDNGDLDVDGSITGSDVLIDDWGSVSASLAAATLTNPITGTGTTNYVSKFTGTNTLGDSLIFDNGTNVGIGTTSPSTELHVVGAITLDDGNGNTKVGNGAGATFTGTNQSVFGYSAGLFNSGTNQTAVGYQAGIFNTGNNQTAFGVNAGIQNTGDNNSNFGYESGLYLSDGGTTNTDSSNSVFLGSNTKALGASQTNQIVIGHNATGIGSNSVTLGNDSIATTALKGNVGIGTTSPGYKLDVAGDMNVGLYTGVDTIRLNFLEGLGYIEAGTFFSSTYITMNNGSGNIFLSAGGDVGIGTTAPSEKLEVNGNILVTDALLSNQSNTDVDTGTEVVAEISSTTYTAAFFDYVIKNDTNLRAGTVFACHDGSGNVEFTEISTNDLGDTSDIVLKVDISGGNIRLTATTISDNWSVKSLVRGL